MTPKEKAKELVEDFYNDIYPVIGIKNGKTFKDYSKAKKGALICVGEMIKEHNEVSENHKWQDERWKWLTEIKQEIEKL